MLTLDVVFWMYVILLAFIRWNARMGKRSAGSFQRHPGIIPDHGVGTVCPVHRDTLSRRPDLSFGLRSLSSSHWCSLDTDPQAPQDCQIRSVYADKLGISLLGVFIRAVNGIT